MTWSGDLDSRNSWVLGIWNSSCSLLRSIRSLRVMVLSSWVHNSRIVNSKQQFPQNSIASCFMFPFPYQTSSNCEIPSTSSSQPTQVSRPHWRSARGSWTRPGSRSGRWSDSPCRAWDPKTSAPWDGRNHAGGMMGYTWYHYLLVMVFRILLMGKSTINGKIHYIILYYKCKNLIFVDWFFF